MKLRAPRCSDSVFLMSAPACGSDPSPSCADATPTDSTVPNSVTAINIKRLRMSRDPLRHRLHAVDFRVPGHQQKECEIKCRADLGQLRIDAGRRFQSADAEDDEGHRKYAQGDFIQRSAIANRQHRRAV